MARRLPTRILTCASVSIAALSSALSSVSPACADVVITGSLSAPSGSSAPLFGIGNADAQPFRTDNHRYELTSVIARVGDQTGIPLVIANLRADDPSGASPAIGKTNYLTTFAVPDLTGVISDRPFVPNSNITLEANTRYWFVLGTVSDDTPENLRRFSWAFSSANGPITGPGTIPALFAETFDEGDTWEVFRDTPFFIEVRGNLIPVQAAPETSALGLLAVAGIPALGLMTCRNARRK